MYTKNNLKNFLNPFFKAQVAQRKTDVGGFFHVDLSKCVLL
jgi:hypothetical protein